jgi:hypothetical protein
VGYSNELLHPSEFTGSGCQLLLVHVSSVVVFNDVVAAEVLSDDGVVKVWVTFGAEVV